MAARRGGNKFGDISGSQVVLGEGNLLVQHVAGDVILPSRVPVYSPKPRWNPGSKLPRPFKGLLDRRQEVRLTLKNLKSCQLIEFVGESGIGKTSLFCHVSHQVDASSFPNGLIYLGRGNKPRRDLLLLLFDFFYDRPYAALPTEGQVLRALKDKRALVLLDDVTLPCNDFEELTNDLPQCKFLITSSRRIIKSQGSTYILKGLPQKDALKLLTRELGRRLGRRELLHAQVVCNALEGHPLRIREAAYQVREGKASLEGLASTRPVDLTEELDERVLNLLRNGEQQALAFLTLLGGQEISIVHLHQLWDAEPADKALATLSSCGLASTLAGGDRMACGVSLELLSEEVLGNLLGSSLGYLADWVTTLPKEQLRLAAELGLIHPLIELAVQSGMFHQLSRLVKAADPVLTASGQLGIRSQALRHCEKAAEKTKDPSLKAWSLHQAGSQALFLGRHGEAKSLLGRALRLREGAGERAAAEITRLNLDLLSKLPKPVVEPLQTGGSALVRAALGILPVIITGVVVWIVDPGSEVIPNRQLLDFGNQLLYKPSSPFLIEFTNPNSRALRIARSSIAGQHKSDFEVTESTCATHELGSGATCSVEIVFTPYGLGERSASLEIIGSGAHLATVNLRGRGTAPDLEISPPQELDFGKQLLGASSPAISAVLKNSGTADLVVEASLTPESLQDFKVASDPCSGKVLPPQANCILQIRFEPRSREGMHRSRLVIRSDAVNNPHELRLIGIATAARLEARPKQIDFQQQQAGFESPQQEMWLESVGTAPVGHINLRLNAEDPKAFSLKEGCQGRTLQPGQECSFALLFRPDKAGIFKGELVIESSASQLIVPLKGDGVQPGLGISPQEIDFESQQTAQQSPLATVTLSSVGSLPLEVGAIGLQGNHSAFQKSSDECSNRRLDPGQRCHIGISFSPAEERAYFAELVIDSNAPLSPHKVILHGLGSSAEPELQIRVWPEELSFGILLLDRSPPKRMAVKVEGFGTGALDLGQASIDPVGLDEPGPNPLPVSEGTFKLVSDECSSKRIPSSGSCEVLVEFAPQQPGKMRAVLVMPVQITKTRIQIPMSGVAKWESWPLARSVEFGETKLGVPKTGSVRVWNGGGGSVFLNRAYLEGAYKDEFEIDDRCNGKPLTSSDSCYINVTFTPRSVGKRSISLTLFFEGRPDSVTVSLTGSGVR